MNFPRPHLTYLRYFKIFRKHTKNRIYLIFSFAILSGLLESIGVMMFIPLLNQGKVANIGKGAYFIKKAFEFLHLEQSFTNTLIIISIIIFLKCTLLFLYYSTLAYVGGELKVVFKKRLFKAISSMKYQNFMQHDTGFINNLLTIEVDRAIQAFIRFAVVNSHIIVMLAYLFASFLVNSQFTIIAISMGSVCLIIFKKASNLTTKLSQSISAQNGKLQGTLIQIIQNTKYLKSTNTFKHVTPQFNKLIKSLFSLELKSNILHGFLTSIIEPIVVIGLCIILYNQVIVQKLTFETVLVAGLLFYRTLITILKISPAWQSFCSQTGGIELFNKYIKEFEDAKENYTKKEIDHFEKNITIDNMSFSYNKDKKILDHISINIDKNSMVGIVGPSGSGKSTIINLLSAILHSNSGNLIIDGKNLLEYDVLKFREKIGYVTQETVVFNDTIENNITLWDSSNNNKERLEKAIKMSLCDNFIDNAENGINTIIGDRGVKLSGGQKQRISMARELYKEPEILLLDEATSSLDTESEKFIQESINGLKGKMTVIIVAHRLSTLVNCDKIFVLKDGKIIQEGPFEQLKNDQNSFFKQLCDNQLIN